MLCMACLWLISSSTLRALSSDKPARIMMASSVVMVWISSALIGPVCSLRTPCPAAIAAALLTPTASCTLTGESRFLRKCKTTSATLAA